MLALADMQGVGLTEFPRTQDISDAVEIHPVTVRRAKTTLLARGLIHTEGNLYFIGPLRQEGVAEPPELLDGDSLLNKFSATELKDFEDFCEKNDLDLAMEAKHCVTWHQEKKKKMKLPKSNLTNWLKISAKKGFKNGTRKPRADNTENSEAGRENYVAPRFTRGTR